MTTGIQRKASNRTEELAQIHARRTLERVTAEYDEVVAAELDANPFGPHTDSTARVLRYLRALPVTGKEVLFAPSNDAWAIGKIVIGAPGNLIVEDDVFDDYTAAARTVLRRRLALFVDTVE
ncbi:hypothetical protein O4220_10025 [Rhodococcus ruber]|uniref:N,N-dimethylformamidase alpha subunit domain-containing protein n=1 Tax=Rhodococcus ruber TaxID=1830 RepID=A0ABT4MFQ0_9NOCA|nr:hypothetical protein [Rhodococcus ruber]MCZ4518855.1 hypothetical protein [Rhodococcus ruber]